MDEIYAKVKETCAAVHDITNTELKAIEDMEVPETRREKVRRNLVNCLNKPLKWGYQLCGMK